MKFFKELKSKIKINKNLYWAVGGQILFAIFLIVAFYGIAFLTKGHYLAGRFKASDAVFRDGSDWAKRIYGLSIAGIVLAFVAILMPLTSMFYKNKTADFALAWTSVLFDVVALAVSISAVALFTNNFAGISHNGVKVNYDKGCVAGQFLFILIGAALAGTGLGFSYKDDWFAISIETKKQKHIQYLMDQLIA